MRRKKKHTDAEIASKLAQAQRMAAEGKLQADIANALGVSVMTLHRWRKLPLEAHKAPAPAKTNQSAQVARHQTQPNRIAELQLENSRLRRLLTDLLLEKMKLEEASLGPKPSTRRTAR